MAGKLSLRVRPVIAVFLLTGSLIALAQPSTTHGAQPTDSATATACQLPVSWWPEDGNPLDVVGWNNPSAVRGISFVPGKVGLGVTFGSGGYIDIPYSPGLDGPQFTVEAWVRPDGPGPNNDAYGSAIVQKALPRSLGGRVASFLLNYSATYKTFLLTVGSLDNATETIRTRPLFPPGVFYHVAATYDGTLLTLYVNGIQVGQRTPEQRLTQDPTIPWTIGSTSAGYRRDYPRTWNGVIDDVKVWNRALSAAEVASIATGDGTVSCVDQRISTLLAGTDGTTGFYLKQVGGPVWAADNENVAFEPASAIKVLLHLYALRQVDNGAAHLTDPIPVLSGGLGSCPQGATQIGTESLQNALKEMMWHSDNWRTLAVRDYFDPSYTRMNDLAQAIGMTNTNLNPNQVLGCPNAYANPDRLTLVDAGKLYEGVANGSLLSPQTVQVFDNLMAGKEEFEAEGYDFTHLWDTAIPAMITQEAPPTMTTAQQQVFQGNMDLQYKAGNYKFCPANNCASYVDDYAIGGVVKIPFCTATGIVPRSYVFGLFINNATSDGASSAAFNATKAELLREQLHAALASCA